MELNTWLIFVGVILLLIASPGPSAILCLSHGVKFGKHKAIATILGGTVASFILMSLSAIGLGAILAASDIAFTIVKVLGAGYLIYLGVRAFFDNSSPVEASQISLQTNQQSKLHLFKQGFVIGISNPKDLLFFAALFPNFIDLSAPQSMQFFTLASTWVIFDFLIMYVYASLGNRISPMFSKMSIIKAFNRSIGGFFIAIGGTILASNK